MLAHFKFKGTEIQQFSVLPQILATQLGNLTSAEHRVLIISVYGSLSPAKKQPNCDRNRRDERFSGPVNTDGEIFWHQTAIKPFHDTWGQV